MGERHVFVVKTHGGSVLRVQPAQMVTVLYQTIEPEPFRYSPPEYIYQPADPFRSEIDRVNADASIQSNHPIWVRKTWLTVHVVFPVFWATLLILLTLVMGEFSLVEVVSLCAPVLIYSGISWVIWRKSGATLK